MASKSDKSGNRRKHDGLFRLGIPSAALFVFAGLFILGQTTAVIAGGGPQNVAVIVNPNDPDSLYVANSYIALRDIPACNVIYIPWKVNVRSSSGADFREKLLRPLFRELERRNLLPQIDFLTFSCGYPYLVDFRAEFPADSLPPQNSPVASLNGAAFLFEDVLESRPQLLSLDSNGYFTATSEGSTSSEAFASQSSWSGGRPLPIGSGRRFFPSTVLGATIGRGNTAEEIVDYLLRAKDADGTRPKGTIYYMQNDNVRSKVRHETFQAAIRELKSLGVNAELMLGSAPIKKDDVAGLTTGTSHLRLRTADCRILPGALVDNLTSAAAQLVVPARIAEPQTPVSEFMRLGAAGASGTVVEPYAIPAKFPTAALHVHYVRGLSLAEAFYRSTQGPFQLLILGDPICQPWAVAPQVYVKGTDESSPLKGVAKLTPSAVYPDQRVVGKYQLFVDGKRHSEIESGQAFTFNSDGVADGWHRLRVVAIDNTPVAAQGAWYADVLVKNGHDALQITPSASRFSVSSIVELRVTSTAADLPTTIMHNGRRLTTLPSGQGTTSIEASKLGKGVVKLEAVQERDGRAVLRARPASIEIY